MKTHLRGLGKHNTVCGRNGIAVPDVSLVTCRDCERKRLNRPAEEQWPQLERLARDIADYVVGRVRDDTASIADHRLQRDETAQACLEMIVADLHGRVNGEEK